LGVQAADKKEGRHRRSHHEAEQQPSAGDAAGGYHRHVSGPSSDGQRMDRMSGSLVHRTRQTIHGTTPHQRCLKHLVTPAHGMTKQQITALNHLNGSEHYLW
jgi:hypothetical protein